MPWASGIFTRARNWVADKAAAINPQAALFDQEDDNFATGLNNCVTKDGQNKPSATMDWNNQRLTNLAAATARVDALQTAQLQDGGPLALGSVSGTDTITGSLTPAITAYANLMRVNFIPAATNTGAATLNINSVAARSIVDVRGTALVAGALVSGVPSSVIYDLSNTRWVLQTDAKVADAQLTSNVVLKNADNIFSSGTQTIAATAAKLVLQDASGGSDEKRTCIQSADVAGKGYRVFSETDAGSSGADLMSCSRSGTAWDAFVLAATSLSITGPLTTPDTTANEIGFKGAPRVTSSPATGQCIAVTAGFTLNTGLAAGKGYSIYNDSASQITITQGGGLTLRLAGTTTTGNRTLEARGLATFWVNSTTEYVISGAGLA